MEEIYNNLLSEIPEEKIYLNEPMKNHTTFKIGGLADIFVKVKTISELKKVLQIAKNKKIPITVLGNGSNVLVKDGRNKRNYN